MEFGRRFPSGGPDPLFAAAFWSAAVLNIIPAALAAPQPVEWLVVGTVHALAIARIASARRASRTQRATDLERFRSLRRDGAPPRA